MDQRLQATTGREYEDFEPETATFQEGDSAIQLVYLPGFRKEQLNVKVSTTVWVTGEHQVENNKWSRVQKGYPVSVNCDPSKIEVRFDEDTLLITQPKLVTRKKTPMNLFMVALLVIVLGFFGSNWFGSGK